MRFDRVTAHAFGPFQGATLALAPGLTVVHGPNEAGKSTWHAALYLGLCGVRRGRGAPRKEEAALAERHRPWHGSAWDVAVSLTLADGRRIDLRQDLLGKVACRAVDADLGRDCSDEIVPDGSPDGARWLGLDRRSFLATACVRQADLLGVAAQADTLQDRLQRAATSARADGTAAAALTRIERFRAERLGSERVNSLKPLRQASLRVDEARDRLDRARAEHADYLALVEESARLAEAASAAERSLRVYQAAQARRDIRDWRRRLDRARALAERLVADGSAPDEDLAGLAERLDAARRQALDQERAAISPAALAGATALAALGIGALVLGQPAAGLALLALGGALLVWLVRRTSRAGPAQTAEIDALRARLEAVEAVQQDRAELHGLLAGQSLDDLATEVDRREAASQRLLQGLDPGLVDALTLDEDLARQVAVLADEAATARRAAAEAQGQLREREARGLRVPDAEEALAAAEAELQHLRQLGDTLERTRQFLAQAQDRTHRDLAPVLATSMTRWLPAVTDGRYQAVRVDPATLGLDVADVLGEWYPAAVLSHGTAEQVYLLLRVALAEHLTAPGEVCPLLLDDVTVHCDATRKRAVLETLHALSQEHQVVLFSQEDAVLAWAESRLRPPTDALIRLP